MTPWPRLGLLGGALPLVVLQFVPVPAARAQGTTVILSDAADSLWQTLSSAAKLPLLFLVTLVVRSPTLYFFNVLFGSNQSLTQNVALILTAITVTAVLLLSFAPIVVFFLVTTAGYQFLEWLTRIDVRPAF